MSTPSLIGVVSNLSSSSSSAPHLASRENSVVRESLSLPQIFTPKKSFKCSPNRVTVKSILAPSRDRSALKSDEKSSTQTNSISPREPEFNGNTSGIDPADWMLPSTLEPALERLETQKREKGGAASASTSLQQPLPGIAWKSKTLGQPPTIDRELRSFMAAKFKELATKTCNAMEKVICELEPPPAHADPNLSLMRENTYFSPLPGEGPLYRDLEVVGEISESLNGAYIRTGPNPQMSPSAGYCFFDGDGMLHTVRIKNGKANYSARYVKTSRFEQEQAAQQPLFIKPFGELHGFSGVARLGLLMLRSALGLVDLSNGQGAANTGLTFFNNRLLAMSEDDLPHVVKVTDEGEVETLDRYNMNGNLKGAMTSHPKVDPVTGELFSISSSFGAAPYLKYFVVSKDGVKGPDVPITIKRPMIAHDFAVTENFAILPDLDLVINIENMIKGGSAIAFDKEKMARLGVLPRYAKDESGIQWFDVPQSFCFHYWTAWEEGDEIVLTGSILVPAEKFFTTARLDLRYEMTEIRLNRATGKASKRVLVPELNLESGQINQRYYGRKCRFVYLAIMEPLPTWVKVVGVAKVDLEESMKEGGTSGVVGVRYFTDEDALGSEPFFVPRSSNPDSAEDDGHLVTYVHDTKTGLSELLIMDAQSPTLETVASIKLPGRVPYGLHGLFISEEQLATQEC
ncbi:unnamed protein product [Calypogeia fissa]